MSNILLGVTIVLGLITIYLYVLDKNKPASVIMTVLTLLSLAITIKPDILSGEKIEPGIDLNTNTLEMLSTDGNDLKAVYSPDDCVVNWHSDNTDIVTVDDNGHLKAVSEGNAVITAAIIYKGMEFKDYCKISVIDPVINLDSTQSLYVGETKNISAITVPEKADLTWESSNPEIVAVHNGEIEAIAEGDAAVTAVMVYNDVDYLAECGVTVVAPDDVPDMKSDRQESADTTEEPKPDAISLMDDSVVWLQEEKVYRETAQKTVREDWDDCIRFGSSNLNADGDANIIVACDQKYSKFTAEIAPQEGFDKSEEVIVYVYAARDGKQISKEEYRINLMTVNTAVELDITGADELYIVKDGNYNQARIAGQYINGYTGMGVLMRNAVLHVE